MKNSINIKNIDAFIFDFDGVLTDNKVYVSQEGIESVMCSREDGLAFDVLKKVTNHIFILSSEKNKIVKSRARKLGISSISGSRDKKKDILKISKINNFNLKNTMYIGNDLNDYFAMKMCGLRVCPNDSHVKIRKLAQIRLKKNGGNGVVREIVEDLLNIDFLKYIS
tara:strand:- start:7 stop:507 length:501 start_codon:yes stop_codon:yes gene_type:complete